MEKYLNLCLFNVIENTMLFRKITNKTLQKDTKMAEIAELTL